MLKLSTQVRSTDHQDRTIILDPTRGKIFAFNPVGSRILELIREGLTEAQIARQISETFSVDLAVVQTDVQNFLGQLAKHHLVATDEKALTRKSS
jgi:Coenzyme PQQ synthesis protein D (PqqD)